MSHSCCHAARPQGSGAASPVSAVDDADRRVPGSAVALDGGEFRMGADDAVGYPEDGEGPVRTVRVSPFLVDAFAVTNDDYGRFVEETGYVTETERIAWSFVFAKFLPGHVRKVSPRPDRTPWWAAVDGATWRTPEGPGSDLAGRGRHPVVHVSHGDAVAYATWVGGRLPTEAEWELAARGGLDQARFPWGDEFTPGGEHRCNTWQGVFPVRNTAEDGYAGTAPVDAFAPNGFGLYNVAGNVWEWCADWFSTDWHARGPGAVQREDPSGPPTGQARVMRGGSYLCHESYCNRYRVAARTSNTPDSAGGNHGFRVVWDVAER